MFDWEAQLGEKATHDLRDPLAVFELLDRKATHTILRPVQREVLAALRDRGTERDLVLKLSTGAGKTTVGLVYLYSQMKASGRPSLYLCPTTQLVGQVLDEAANLGIPAVAYPANQKHPGVEALRGEAIVVCTYDKLFNAKTTFERQDVQLYPHAIVLDDAHAGIEEVRDSFTLTIPSSSSRHPFLANVYKEVLKVLEPACGPHMPSSWAFIERGQPDAVLEVPYWLWADIAPRVLQVIDPYGNESPVCFVWPYLRDILRWCRCIVSGVTIEIAPDVVPIDAVAPYDRAAHRVYMSATLSDDSALVRELGSALDAALTPIIPPSDAGVGERMVLAPTLIDPKLDRNWVMSWCGELAKSASVVVLSSSEKQAREWAPFGATVVLGDRVDDAVHDLKQSASGFVVFAQRYDGIDLPDDACRVLVLDGMPRGSSTLDTMDADDPGRPGGAVEKWVHRVEQGMGRAVRSHVDYAVVILAGPEITHFVSQADVRERLGHGTRAQLDLARELMQMVQDEAKNTSSEVAVKQMAQQCLRREPGWKKFYDRRVRQASKATSHLVDEDAIRLAEAEREAFVNARANDVAGAARSLDGAISARLKREPYKGWYLQKEANYLFSVDPARAMEVQRQAYKKNRKLMLPPMGVQVRRPAPEKLHAAATVHQWLSKFVDGNGAVVEFNMIRPKLSFESPSEQFEQGLFELAALIGADGSRPEKEYGRGPDDMWGWPDDDWILEAKNERSVRLPKADGEQLLAAQRWHQENFPERRCVPVVAARIPSPEQDAFFPEGTRGLTPELLEDLLGNVERFIAELAGQLPLFRNVEHVRDALRRHGLAADEFRNRYTVALGPRRRRPR